MWTDKKIKIYIVIISVMAMIACGDNGHKHPRSKEQDNRLSLLYDSIGYADDKFLSICDSMLRQAQDSLDYYDIFVAKGGHYTIHNPADSMLYYANKTIAFIDRCEYKGERLYGLAGKAYSLKATYFHQMRQEKDSAITLFKKAYDYTLRSDVKQSATAPATPTWVSTRGRNTMYGLRMRPVSSKRNGWSRSTPASGASTHFPSAPTIP